MTTSAILSCFSLVTIGLASCQTSNAYLVRDTPHGTPIRFMPEVVPEGRLVHRGTFSPDLSEYYFTTSDHNFTQFDVHAIRKQGESWSAPQAAFFNSAHNEHGASFSPDGRFLYFSSTRPTPIEGLPTTWHLWRTERIHGRWTEPEFVDIPNLRDKLVSHPSLSSDGTLYFHAGNPDYTELHIHSAEQSDGVFQEATTLPSTINAGTTQVTPFVSPDESYLLFERPPDIYISYRDDAEQWSAALPLGREVNTNGKGNPFVTPDEEYLFFVAGNATQPGEAESWSVFWMSTASILMRR